MKDIIDRQTIIISINCWNFNNGAGGKPSEVQLPMNLRFAAEELIVKHISYCGPISPNDTEHDIADCVQIWCNITNDGLIGSFQNGSEITLPNSCHHNDHFRINNTFQTGNLILQLQQTGSGNPASCSPQPLISSLTAQSTKGVVVITIEFVKYSK